MHATFKPHHFLDFLYEIALNNGVFKTENRYGHIMGYYGNLLSAGKIDTVSFTSGADDPCGPCRNLVDGICTDVFKPEAAAKYGFPRKYEHNLRLDTVIESALPEVFSFDRECSIDDVYAQLKEKLTPEIILLNWEREDRVALTYRGLDIAIQARKS